MQDFHDKVAVITGAASGIGCAIAERCVQEGMKFENILQQRNPA